MRWYLAFRKVGKPQRVIQDVTKQVEDGNLGAYIPVLRVEKKARGEFYVFLGIESEALGDIPLQARRVVNYLGHPYEAPFTLQEIRTMTTGDVDVVSYSRRIRYRPTRSIWDDDPFERFDETVELSEDNLARTQQYDKLLFWVSAIGTGTWPQFRGACEALGLATRPGAPRQILRRFRLLGHAETSGDGMTWSVAPAVIADVASADGQTRAVLCGQRDSALLQDIHRFASVVEVIQPEGQGPAVVQVLGSVVDLRLPGRVLAHGGDVSETLAEVLPPLHGWVAALPTVSRVIPHAYTVRRYNGFSFEDAEFIGESGLYELSSSSPGSTPRPPLTLFYDATRERWIRGDWYGLRFLACQSLGMSTDARYDSGTHRLAVPFETRWPELYERALVLGSGMLPRRRGAWMVYEAIAPTVSQHLAEKLSISLQEDGINA